MNENDKIDLKDVNKKKASLKRPSLTAFKKQKGPKRDEVGKFAPTTGGGGLKSFKSFNWKRAFPLIAVIAVVGGFLVYQSFAATNQLSRGGPENHNGSRDCKNLPANYVVPYEKRAWLGRNVTEGAVKNAFMYHHKKLATVDEVLYWVTTRNSELKNLYGSNCVAIAYIAYLEIKELKTFGIDKEIQEEQATSSADVFHKVYAHEIKRPGSASSRARQVAVTDGLPVLGIGVDYTAYAKQWQSSWPSKYRACATVYSLTGPFGIVSFAGETFDLSTLTNLQSKKPYTYTPQDGRTRQVYPAAKYLLCTKHKDAPKARNTGTRQIPPVVSLNVSAMLSGEAAERNTKGSGGTGKAFFLLESYSLMK